MSAEAKEQPEIYFNVASGELYVGALALNTAIEEANHDPSLIKPVAEVITDPEFSFTHTDFDKLPCEDWQEPDFIAHGKWMNSIVSSVTSKERAPEKYYQNAYKLGIGPEKRRIVRRFGSMWQFNEAIGSEGGFSRGQYSSWETEDFIKYAKDLEAQIGKKPEKKDFHGKFLAGEGPSTSIIYAKVGSIGFLQENLGYPDITKWDKDDYIAWGLQVLRANPGKTLARSLIHKLSVQGRGPSPRIIGEYFGTLTAYQQMVYGENKLIESDVIDEPVIEHLKVDLHPNEAIIVRNSEGTNHSRKNKPNLPYFFNVRTGELLLDGRNPEAMVEYGYDPRDFEPLQEIIKDPDSPILEENKYTAANVENWTEEDYVNYGKWLGSFAIGESGRMNHGILANSYKLGLGPYPKRIQRRFDTLGRFYDACEFVGIHNIGKYSEWTLEDFVSHATIVSRKLKRKPNSEDFQKWFQEGKGPSTAIIERRIGIRKLYEFIGFPNVQDWEEQDYIDYGVRVMQANPDSKVPTSTMLNNLSKQKRGPSTRTIYDHFESLADYQALVLDELQSVKRTQDAKHMEITRQLEEGDLPEELFDPNMENLYRNVAQYYLVKSLLGIESKKQLLAYAKRSPDRLVKALTEQSQGKLSVARIEATASQLGLFDDIWVMDGYKKYLKASSTRR